MSYLTFHHGTYWFQIRVPQGSIPRHGRLIRLNLQTSDHAVAQPLALQLAGRWLQRFAAERAGADQLLLELDVATDQIPPALEGMSVSQIACLAREPDQQIERSIRQAHGIRRLSEEVDDTLDGLLWYWRSLHPECAASTYREVESVVKHFKRFTKRKAPSRLVRRDVIAYRDRCLADGLARATVGKKISLLATLLRTAHEGELLSANVARGIRIPRSKAQPPRRREFTVEELTRIFSSSIYSKALRPRGGGGEAAVWLPAMALCTGMRLEELAQLKTADVENDGPHGWLIRVTDTGSGQRLKNNNSRRVIPVHPGLLGAGFDRYISSVSHEVWLFPALEPDHDGRRGGTFSQWWSRYLRSPKGCDIPDQRVVFHSFRHGFKTLCRKAGIDEEVHDALTGHASRSVGRDYGSVPLEALVDAIRSIRLPVALPNLAQGGAR